MTGSGSKSLPLRPRASSKRPNESVNDLAFSSPKRMKTSSLPTIPERRQQEDIIDLTRDEPQYVPTRRPLNRPALATMTNSTGVYQPASRRKHRHPRQHRSQGDLVHGETIGVLAKIASKLRASAHAIDIDRDTLRQRWEVDGNLQRQTVTDHLADLNHYFTRAEDGIRDALTVIEDSLLSS